MVAELVGAGGHEPLDRLRLGRLLVCVGYESASGRTERQGSMEQIGRLEFAERGPPLIVGSVKVVDRDRDIGPGGGRPPDHDRRGRRAARWPHDGRPCYQRRQQRTQREHQPSYVAGQVAPGHATLDLSLGPIDIPQVRLNGKSAVMPEARLGPFHHTRTNMIETRAPVAKPYPKVRTTPRSSRRRSRASSDRSSGRADHDHLAWTIGSSPAAKKPPNASPSPMSVINQ